MGSGGRSVRGRGLLTEASRLRSTALASGALFLLFVGWRIAGRGGLDHDELHTLLLARLWAAGDVLPFAVGSVTRYEGGSWLVAWPVSWLLRLGVDPTLAPSVFSALWAAFGVVGGALWLGPRADRRAALLLGPVLAVATPEVTWYAQRAWGSLLEGLALLPWIALLAAKRRPLALGLAVAVGAVVSYVHAITALAGAALWMRAGRRRELLLAGGAAALGFGAWLLGAVPHVEQALVVRGGHGLLGLTSHLVPRLHRVVPDLPAAFAGPLRSGWSLGLGAALALLALAALVRAARDEELRGLAVYAAVAVFALSAGHELADPPEVHRYALPLLVVSAAALAAWPRARVGALLLGLGLWLPPPAPTGQPPHAVYAQLGANAQDRVHADPHVKAKALWRVAEPWARPWLYAGYGLDQGRRHRGVVAGITARLGEGADAADPHFALQEPSSWVAWLRPLGDAPERQAFLVGLGRGVAEDGPNPEDEVLRAALTPQERGWFDAGTGLAAPDGPQRAWRSLELRTAR